MLRFILLVTSALMLTACGGPTDNEVRDALQEGSYETDTEIAELSWHSRYSIAKVPGDDESRYSVNYTIVRRSKLPVLQQVEATSAEDGRFISPYETFCPLSPSLMIPAERELPTVYQKTLPAGTLMRTKGEMLMTKAPTETHYTKAVSEPSIYDENAKAYLDGTTSAILSNDKASWVEQGSPEFQAVCKQLKTEIEK